MEVELRANGSVLTRLTDPCDSIVDVVAQVAASLSGILRLRSIGILQYRDTPSTSKDPFFCHRSCAGGDTAAPARNRRDQQTQVNVPRPDGYFPCDAIHVDLQQRQWRIGPSGWTWTVIRQRPAAATFQKGYCWGYRNQTEIKNSINYRPFCMISVLSWE